MPSLNPPWKIRGKEQMTKQMPKTYGWIIGVGICDLYFFQAVTLFLLLFSVMYNLGPCKKYYPTMCGLEVARGVLNHDLQVIPLLSLTMRDLHFGAYTNLHPGKNKNMLRGILFCTLTMMVWTLDMEFVALQSVWMLFIHLQCFWM